MTSFKPEAHFGTVRMALQNATEYLNSHGVPSARLEAEVLLAHLLGVERLKLYASPEQTLSSLQEENYRSLLLKRASGVPTAYLRGKKEFFSRSFRVGPGVLIPRAETELLVEQSLELLKSASAPILLEIGTGSGAIVISIAAQLSSARGMATEISPQALKFAVDNAEIHGVRSRITFYEGDLFAPLPAGIQFDLIVSNPPYIPTSEITPLLGFEPREALDGGKDGLKFYRLILSQAWKFMKPQSPLLLEISGTNLPFLNDLLKESLSFYDSPEYFQDLAGSTRAMAVRRKT